MFARKRGETVDQDLDFDTKSQIGKALKEEWLKCKSAQDETPHLQNIMEMLHGDALAPPPDNVDCADWAPGFPQLPSETCTRLMDKWVQFQLTDFKLYWRIIPDQANDSFVLVDRHNFSVLFSVLPGLLQHPCQKSESANHSSIAEQVIAQLKVVAAKYRRIIEGWPKDHPRYPQLSQFIADAFVSFSRASYFYAVPLKNCIEAASGSALNLNVFSPTLEYMQMKGGLQILKDHTCCCVEVCSVGEGKKQNMPFQTICETLNLLFIETRRHSHLTEDQFRVQDTCYELLFRVAAFGLDKRSAPYFISELENNGILQGSIDWPHTFLPAHRRQHKRQIPNATTVKWTCSHLIKHLHLLKIIVHTLGQLGLLQDRETLQKLFDPQNQGSSDFLSTSLLLKHGITNAILWMYSSVPVPSTVPDSVEMQAHNMENQAFAAITAFSSEVMTKMSPDNRALAVFNMDADVDIVRKAALRKAAVQPASAVDEFSRSFAILSSELDDSNQIEKFLRVFIGLIKATSPSPAQSSPENNPPHELRMKLIDAVVNVFDEKSEENQAAGTGEEAKTPEHVSKVRRSLLETCSTLQFSALKFFAHLSVLTQGTVSPPVSEIIRKSGFMDFIFGQSIMCAPECPYFFKHPSAQAQVDPSSLQCQYIRALRQCAVNFLADMPSIDDSSFTELLLLLKQLFSFIAARDAFSVEMILSAMHSINNKRERNFAGEKFHKMGLDLKVPSLLQDFSGIMHDVRSDPSKQSDLENWERVFLLFCVVMHEILNEKQCRYAMLLPSNLRPWLDLMYWPELRFFASLQIREAVSFVLSESKDPPVAVLKSALDTIFLNFTTYHDPQVKTPARFAADDLRHRKSFIIGLLHLTYCLCVSPDQTKSVKINLQECFMQADVFTHLSCLLHLPEGQSVGDEFLAACVVRCIGVIMHASVQGKKAFSLYGEFSRLLWSWCGTSSRAYLVKDALKYMAFDPVKSNRITNGEVVKLMIDLSRHFTDEHAIMYQYKIIQETADDTLLRDDVRDVISATECCAVGLLSSLIEWLSAIAIQEEAATQSGSVGSPDMLQAYVIRVVKILGAHKIKVKDFKDWFRLLRPRHDSRPALFKELLKNLISMVETSSDVVSFFVFDGPDAGLKFQQNTEKESRGLHGHSLCFWLQFSKADMEAFCQERSPHVLTHFWNKKGDVQQMVVFDETCIKVVFRDKDGEWSTTQLKLKTPAKWTPGKWHFLCISFTPSHGGVFSRKPPLIEFFLDNNKQSSAAPTQSKMFDFGSFHGVVANVADQLGDFQSIDVQLQQYPIGREFDELKAFNGRMAGFSLLREALTEESVKDYGNIETLMSASSKLSSCLFSINPRACAVGSSDLSGSVQQREYANVGFSPPDSPLSNAVVVGKTIPVVSTSAKQMLECIGGVRAIFPLLQVIEQGDADPSLASMVIEFLVSVCQECKLNVRSFFESKGFEILHLRLRKLKPYFKTQELFISIKKLIATVYASLQEKQDDEHIQALARIVTIVEFTPQRQDFAEKSKREREENKFLASMLVLDPRLWVDSSPKCFKMVFSHLISESLNGFSLDPKFFHRTPLALVLRLVCRFLSTSSAHRSILSFKIDEKLDNISIEYLNHVSDPKAVEVDEAFTPETINEYRSFILGRFCDKIGRRIQSSAQHFLLEYDSRLLISFIVSIEEPTLLNDLVALLCNMAFQLHAKSEDSMFDWLNSSPLPVDQSLNISKSASSRKPDYPKVDIISVLTMQMARVSENSRCHITQLLCLWYSKMGLPRFQNLSKKHSSQSEFRSMLVAVMSRLESPPPSLNDVVTLICGATNIFECMRAPSARATEPAAAGAEGTSVAAVDDVGRSSDATDATLRRKEACFSIEELSDLIIPRMIEFSTIPSLSCDLVSNFHLFCPVLLLLRFLPRKDFCTVVDILREVFSTIPNDQKLVVISSLQLRITDSVAAAPRSGPSLEGNLVIWFTKAILNARCTAEIREEDIEKLREILCNLFVIAIEDCPLGYKFVEECVYIIYQDPDISSAIRDNEAHRLIMSLCLQIQTKVVLKSALHHNDISWGKQTEFAKNICKFLEFLGSFFFYMSPALSPDTYEKCTAKVPEFTRDPESDFVSWLAGHRRAILNFCRPLSHAPASAFEWKDCDLALCAIEISGTLLSEFLRGVREAYRVHPHTKEAHEEVTKGIFSSEMESHMSIALKVSLQILKVLILDSLSKGHAENFSKYVSQFTVFVSESHGSTCPEKKCGADISMKTSSKTSSYDPFFLECVAFIHQQALASHHNFQIASSGSEADDASRQFRDSMNQCRTTCLQSLHQLVQRSILNIKTAAPDLKLDPDSFMGMTDEDDSRSISERLFDEYCSPSSPFFKASLKILWPFSSKDIESTQQACALFQMDVKFLLKELDNDLAHNVLWSVLDKTTERSSEMLMQEFVVFWRYIDKEKKQLRYTQYKAERASSDIVENERNVWAKKDDGSTILEIVPMEFPRMDTFRTCEGQFRMRMKLCKKKFQCRHVAASRRLHDEESESAESPQLKAQLSPQQLHAADPALEDAAEDDDVDVGGQAAHAPKETKFENVWQLFPVGDPVQGALNVTKESITFIPKNELQKWQRTWSTKCACQVQWDQAAGNEWVLSKGQPPVMCRVDTEKPAHFYDMNRPKNNPKKRTWLLSEIREVYKRRYNFRQESIELYLSSGKTVLLRFENGLKDVKDIFKTLKKALSEANFVEQSQEKRNRRRDELVSLWQSHKITNFEYLMQLNILAGRTYQDLEQYPVFPWILADYGSENLDLSKKESFRDLSKPMGALNRHRLELGLRNYHEKKENFDEMGADMDPVLRQQSQSTVCMWKAGFYSTAAYVLRYLIRVEPFTTYHIDYQSGRFDHTDRNFYSVVNDWENSSGLDAFGKIKKTANFADDYRELIPEFFYLPEMFTNENGFDLGELPGKRSISNVILPPWAKNSPDLFVRKHREALESQHVSDHLHEWIDLMFGANQPYESPAALAAFNLFSPVCYKRTSDTAPAFGVVPSQLWTTPSPRRRPMTSDKDPQLAGGKRLGAGPKTTAGSIQAIYCGPPDGPKAVCFMCCMPNDQAYTISQDRKLLLHCFLPQDQTLRLETDLVRSKSFRRIGTAFAVPNPAQHLFALALFPKGNHMVYSCGYWDNSVVCSRLSDGTTEASSMDFHKDVCTCIAVDTQAYRYLVTGSADTTVLVWDIANCSSANKYGLLAPVQTLYGHDNKVTCVAINCAMNMIVSGSSDGTLMIHDLYGRYVRSIYIPDKGCVKSFVVSQLGSIFVLSGAASSDAASCMHHYSPNGRRVHSDANAGEGVNCMLLYSHPMLPFEHRELLIQGRRSGMVVLSTIDFKKLWPRPADQRSVFKNPVISLATSADGKRVLAGTPDGMLQQHPILEIMLEILEEAKAAADAKAVTEARAAAEAQPVAEAKALEEDKVDTQASGAAQALQASQAKAPLDLP